MVPYILVMYVQLKVQLDVLDVHLVGPLIEHIVTNTLTRM
jgi:hypothetical protein